jgi:hypothetical protein
MNKAVIKVQKQLINCSVENLEISKKLQSLKQTINNDNLLFDIHREEIQTFVEKYAENSILIGESIVMLGLDETNFMLN